MYRNLSAGAVGIAANLSEALALAKGNGFAGIDFSIVEAATLAKEEGLGHVQDLFALSGIRPGAWSFPVDFRWKEETWRQGLDALPAQAELAGQLGCYRTATWIMPCSDEMEFQENFDFHVKRLQPAAQILAEHDMRLGLEFVGPKTLRDTKKYPFIHDMDGMLELCAAIGPNVGLLLDIYHLYTSHGSMDDVRALSNEQIVVVHVNDAPAGVPVDEQLDNVRALPGETGVLDIVGFLHALRDIGYDGPVTPEPFSRRLNEMKPTEAAAVAGDAMAQIWQAAGLED